MSNGRESRQYKVTLIACIVALASLATALCFVLLLVPAASSYTNLLPAVLGVLTLIQTAVLSIMTLLKAEQNEAVIKKVENEVGVVTDVAAMTTEINQVVNEANSENPPSGKHRKPDAPS